MGEILPNIPFVSVASHTVYFSVCVQLISDAGYQGEITSVSTACQQLEVFSRVLRTSLATLLDGGEENLEKNLPEFAVSVTHRSQSLSLLIFNHDAMKYCALFHFFFFLKKYIKWLSTYWSRCLVLNDKLQLLWLTICSSITLNRSLLFSAEDGVSRRAHLPVCPGHDVHPGSGGTGRFSCS